MPDWTVCAHCNLKHRPRLDGCCPRCKEPAADTGVEPAADTTAATGAMGLPDIYDGRSAGGSHDTAGHRTRSSSGVVWLGAMALVVGAVGGIAYWMNRELPDATTPLGGVRKLQAPPVVEQRRLGEFAAASQPGGQPQLPGIEERQVSEPNATAAWREQEQKRVDRMNNSAQCKSASEAMWVAKTVGNSRGAASMRVGNRVLSESERVEVLNESQQFYDENCRR